MPQKVVVVGAGPVGSLAALYAAVRGHDVEIYELRPGESSGRFFHYNTNTNTNTNTDLRDPGTTPLNLAKSINLALSERGINSLRESGLSEVVDLILGDTFPMHGRMIHVRKLGRYVREPQLYDARGKVRAILTLQVIHTHSNRASSPWTEPS
jgi:kynurenine 3-monooxygenase